MFIKVFFKKKKKFKTIWQNKNEKENNQNKNFKGKSLIIDIKKEIIQNNLNKRYKLTKKWRNLIIITRM